MILLNDNEYYKWLHEQNILYEKSQRRKKFVDYLKKNHLSIIALIISLIALFKE